MALFTDGSISGVEDLTAQDAGVLEVSSVERIDLTGKLQLAHQELEMELAAMLADSQRLVASDVVVTGPLKLWHVFRTLELVYRDASHNQLNERYAGKREEFRRLCRWAYDNLRQVGLGIAADAVPRAEQPLLRAVNGLLPEGTYLATMSWVGRSGAEGGSAIPAAIILAPARGFEVEAVSPPANAVGWNVYAGTSDDNLVMQNPSLLDPSQVWQQTVAPSTLGRKAGTGQPPSYLLPFPRFMRRG